MPGISVGELPRERLALLDTSRPALENLEPWAIPVLAEGKGVWTGLPGAEAVGRLARENWTFAFRGPALPRDSDRVRAADGDRATTRSAEPT